MGVLKGQFMLISAIIIGLMIISTGAIVSKVQSQQVENDMTAMHLQMIKEEASKIDMGDAKERRNFKKMVGMLDNYDTGVEFWNRQNCFNVTLVRPHSRFELACTG